MRRAALAIVLLLTSGVAASCGGGNEGAPPAADLGEPVAFAEVLSVFEKYGCAGCHPSVMPALDLTAQNAYENLVGVRALLDPTLVRVVAGDPGSSLLYLKLGGDPPVLDIPAIGSRMPPGAPPIDPADLDVVRRWILQGAKNADGQTVGPEVPTPGKPPTDLDVVAARSPEGTATITGSVVGQDREPVEGALVTLLLRGPDAPGGEEHYRVAVTDEEGRFRLPGAPSGQFLLKAYGPNTIYVTRIVALDEGETQDVAFGLPDRVIENPTVGNPEAKRTATGTALSLDVQGNDLDSNYVLAVNPAAGLVFELHAPGDAPGRWSREIDQTLEGPWLFLAVDRDCNISEFVTAP
jgi:Carboxypeptidase regulatory-like domain